uniref:Alcohol dehydrogenase like protein cytoplasmic n=1 Tax=Nigella sativa TaxID=555479 RepID=A0A899HDA1_NIGSA|nr:alcohol dehydrogenase like protein cytoplasmic [Nigella sativa]
MGSMGDESKESFNGVFVPNDTRGKVITCKAAVAWGPKEPLVIQDVQVDPPQSMEVRIKIVFTSICHTDLSAWLGENENQRAFPRILGHEAAGIVESVGEGVIDMKEGDHVVPLFNGECGDCVYCKSEKTNLCGKLRVNPMKRVMSIDGKSRFSSMDGKPIYHFLSTSTFSEYTVVDSGCVVKIDPNASLKKMSLLSCGVSTGVGAAWNTANVQPGSTVAVFGLGAVGLAAAAGARAKGATRIIGVDINPDKFVKGKIMGMTEFINPKDLKRCVNEEIKELTEGGVDYSFECTGNLEVLREAFLSTHDGWGLTVILGIHGSPRLMPVHPMELFDGRRITGSVFGDFKGKSQLPQFAEECLNGVINLDEFITHELPFSKINEAFQLLIEGKSLRCVLQL